MEASDKPPRVLMLPGCQAEEVGVHSRRAASVAEERGGRVSSASRGARGAGASRFACDVERRRNPGRDAIQIKFLKGV